MNEKCHTETVWHNSWLTSDIVQTTFFVITFKILTMTFDSLQLYLKYLLTCNKSSNGRVDVKKIVLNLLCFVCGTRQQLYHRPAFLKDSDAVNTQTYY